MIDLLKIFLSCNILILLLIFFQKKFYFLLSNNSFSNHKSFINNTNFVPMSGGIYLFLTLLLFKYQIFFNLNILILIAILFTGILSDVIKNFSPRLRLFIQFILILIFLVKNEIFISDTRINFFNHLLEIKLITYLFTSYCLLILINGANFIDGINLSAAGYFLIIIAAVFFLGLNNEVTFDLYLTKVLIISLVVFLFFNFLKYAFLGDNGVYLLSFISGVFVIQLITSNAIISPYFAINLLWYPCFENLFSIIRKIISKKDPMTPDNMHLHHLLYFFIKNHFNLSANNLTGLVILINNFLIIFFSLLYFNQTKFLILIIVFSIMYYLISFYLLRKYFLNFTLKGNSK
jgi:UDP-N-acetylmuramyl pentapeptide phosphotransferase/UDP-N-acetylglucosamine-1-phosphate transferase